MSSGRHGPQAAVAVADRPLVAERGDHGDADGLRFEPAHRVGVDVVVEPSAPRTWTVPWSREPGRQASSGPYAGCTLGSGWMTSPNTPLTQSMTASVERKLAESTSRSRADLIGGGEVHGDVGAPEPVDRLLRVADDEQPAGNRTQAADVVGGLVVRRRGEADGDLQLDRVGVLELVEEHAAVVVVQAGAHVGPRGEQAAGEHEQVVELERAGRRSLAGAVEDEAAGDRPDHAPGGTRATGRK